MGSLIRQVAAQIILNMFVDALGNEKIKLVALKPSTVASNPSSANLINLVHVHARRARERKEKQVYLRRIQINGVAHAAALSTRDYIRSFL
jgi:hypothetical protein